MNSLPLLGFDFGHLVSHADGNFFKHFVEPHKLLKFHLLDAPDRFVRHTGAEPDAVEQFWSSLLSSIVGQEMQQEHSFLRGRTPHSLRHTLPLVIHEDAAPFSKRCSVSVVSCSNILGM